MRLARSARLVCAALLALGVLPARAEDFTGFYAGVNAGYAFGRDGGRTPLALPDASTAEDRGLPPSAQGAAQALRKDRPGSRPGRASR